MKALGFALLGLLCAASIAVAATARRPVMLPSKACCETCTVARFVPPLVPAVPASMVLGALIMQASLLGVAALGMVLVRRLRPATALVPRPASEPHASQASATPHPAEA